MLYNEAKAVVSAGRHLPAHFDWLIKEARSVVARNDVDRHALQRADMATMSPHAYEQVNLALAMRLAIACNVALFGIAAPAAIKVRKPVLADVATHTVASLAAVA